MSESMGERVAEARAQLEATRAAVARARAELGSASTTARSKDRSVEVTVGPQGELTRLKFLDGKYQTMEAAQLAASVLEAAGKGRAAMARRVMDTFSAVSPPDENAANIPGYNPDWEQIFGPALSAGQRARNAGSARPSRRSGRPSGAGLRDEIVEDGNDG
jgi:multidrug efflux pump subunit AcrA (membrane-fusion protein)